MAHAVADAIDGGEHLLVQAGTGTGKSLAYLVPAVRHAMDDRHARRRRHRDAGAAGPDRRPRHAPPGRGARAAARPAPDLRARQGPPQLPVRAQARGRLPRRRRRHPARRSGRSTSRRPGWAPRWCGCASGPRSPSPATATSWCPGSASGPGARCRCRRHECLGGRCPMVAECFVERSREAARTSTSSSPTTRSWPSTPSRAARCCPSTTCSSSTRGTSSSTGSPRRSPTRSRPAMVRARPRSAAGRQADSGSTRWTRPPTCSRRCSSRRPEGRLDRLPDSLGAGARPGARHRPGRAERAQAAAGRGARRRRARWPGPRSTRCSRTPRASSRSASSTSCGSTATRGGARCCTWRR